MIYSPDRGNSPVCVWIWEDNDGYWVPSGAWGVWKVCSPLGWRAVA